ncbi:hypothetical protein OS493_027064 [Desmophyllum pertusum]|uniref:Uncharacterized protein n=1 Tax=Desmophyllum pertusum TaxID=174260 RepID=A0A9W9Y9H2_9CNID|nr:hypothetical protein OS493_027064 [Desmophyllum pertusum]
MDWQLSRSRQILLRTGIYRNMESTEWRGKSHKFTNKQFTCTWFATKKSLLIQGKKASELKDKLKEVLVRPIPLIAAKDESETTVEVDGSEKAKSQHESPVEDYKGTKCSAMCVATEVQEGNEFNEGEIRDGLSPGKAIKNLLEFRLKKWDWEGAKVTIATPFMDKAGLIFIQSCLQNETALVKIYTREVCGWNNKKIDRVIAEAELLKKWFVNKVVALKKSPSFHAKFLAGEYTDKVELIVTSSNMTSEHLFSDQLETVMQIECTAEMFHSDWLRPLENMAEEEGNMTKFLNMDDIMQEVQNIENTINAPH